MANSPLVHYVFFPKVFLYSRGYASLLLSLSLSLESDKTNITQSLRGVLKKRKHTRNYVINYMYFYNTQNKYFIHCKHLIKLKKLRGTEKHR